MDPESIVKLGPVGALSVALLMIGFFLKKSPIQNWTIPWLVAGIGGAVYPWIAITAKSDTGNPFLLNTVYGTIMGLTVVGGHQAVKQWLDFRDQQKSGELPKGDTTLIAKEKPDEKKPD